MGDKMTNETDLQTKIKKIGKFFKIKLTVIFTDSLVKTKGEYDPNGRLINVRPNQSKGNILLTIIHEALHQLGFDHDTNMRKVGYWSGWKNNRDTFSEYVSGLIFKRKIKWGKI
jgi:hypothetical protein